MKPPDNIADLFGMRVIDRATGRHGRIRSGRDFPTSTGKLAEVVVCFDGLPEPVGLLSDYYNVRQLDEEVAPWTR